MWGNNKVAATQICPKNNYPKPSPIRPVVSIWFQKFINLDLAVNEFCMNSGTENKGNIVLGYHDTIQGDGLS